MPNWTYLVVNFLYELGLALWIGGTLALGGIVAPFLFKTLPRENAGGLFGPILWRFARLRIVAVVLIIFGGAVRYLAWETHAFVAWIALRWLAIAFLAFTVVYEIGFLEPAMERRRVELTRVELTPGQGEDDPHRRAFQKLHRRAELLMKSSLIAALVALFFN